MFFLRVMYTGAHVCKRNELMEADRLSISGEGAYRTYALYAMSEDSCALLQRDGKAHIIDESMFREMLPQMEEGDSLLVEVEGRDQLSNSYRDFFECI